MTVDVAPGTYDLLAVVRIDGQRLVPDSGIGLREGTDPAR